MKPPFNYYSLFSSHRFITFVTLILISYIYNFNVFSSESVNSISIYDIQYTENSNGNSPFFNKAVTITGTVTGVFYDGYIVSEDPGPWKSIYVYSYKERPRRGQVVELTGRVQEYNFMTEIINVIDYKVLAENETIEPVVLDAVNAATEAYESVLVTIKNPTVTNLTINGEWQISDSTGTLLCDDKNDYLYFPETGDSLNSITGIIFYSGLKYKLEPRNTNDVSGNQIQHYAISGDVVTMNDNHDILTDTFIEIRGDQIVSVSNVQPDQIPVYPVNGYIFPGFIDAHNHPTWNVLDITPFGQTFNERAEWRGSTINALVSNQFNDIVDYGGINNQLANIIKLAEIRALCSGTTMIQGRDCYNHLQDVFGREGIGINNVERFPSRVKSSVFPLNEDQLYWKLRAEENWDRFVIHIAEGVNSESLDEFYSWQNMDMLDERTTIIHGVALTENEYTEMAKVDANLVWSPASNWELYNATANIPAALSAGVNIAIAPDWTLSGMPNILEEIRFADRINKILWNNVITPRQFADFITRNAAKAMGQHNRLGILAPDYQADITIVQKRSDDPYESLLQSSADDIILAIVNGLPVYGDPQIMESFSFQDNPEDITINGVAKKIDITLDCHAIPESDKSVAEIMTELYEAWENSDPQVCRFLHFDPQQNDFWNYQEPEILDNICCIDAVNAQILWAATSNGKIIKTLDGGNTWQSVRNDHNLSYIQFIDAVDENTILISGGSDSLTTMSNQIIRTDNSGQTWNYVFEQTGGSILDIIMFNELNGLIIGDPVEGVWTIASTSDGGINWEPIDNAPVQKDDEKGIPGAVFWTNTMNGWFGTDKGRFYNTLDGGNSWTDTTIPDLDAITKIAYSESGNGVIADNDKLFRTTGNIYELLDPPGYGNCDFIYYHDNCFWISYADHALYYSTNNGETWQFSTNATARLLCMEFVQSGEKSSIWAAGNTGIIINAQLSAPMDIPEEKKVATSYILFQNYPNPFNTSTTISYNVAEKSRVRIEIFDAIGRLVTTLANAEQQPGTYQLDWNAASHSSGVYLCRMTAGSYTSVKKMLLIK